MFPFWIRIMIPTLNVDSDPGGKNESGLMRIRIHSPATKLDFGNVFRK